MCGTTTIETEVTARIDKRGPSGEDASIAQFVASAALAIAARARHGCHREEAAHISASTLRHSAEPATSESR